jgi:hypothetical protein
VSDVDGDNTTDPGAPGGPFFNGLNSHKRCLNACTTPPTNTQGIFWDEQGSPDITGNIATDNNDFLDVLNLCLANGGSN